MDVPVVYAVSSALAAAGTSGSAAVALSTQSSGGAQANGVFTFQDANPGDGREPAAVQGFVYFAFPHAGIRTGDSTGYSATNGIGATITLNGQTIGSFSATSERRDNFFTTGFVETIQINGQDTLVQSGLLSFSAPAGNGAVLGIGVNAQSFAGALAQDLPGSANAQAHAVIAVWATMTDSFTPPQPPQPPISPLPEPNDPIAGSFTPPFAYSDAPGDLNGDGAIDADDNELWMLDLVKWTTGQRSSLIVSNDIDENDGNYSYGNLSLREAIALAADANHPGQDTIVFAPWVHQITLTYDGPDSGAAPDQLTLSSDIILVGPGADELAINANQNSRVFSVDSGVGVTIRGLTVTGGAVTASSPNGNHGGGIYNLGNLTLQEVAVVNNRTDYAAASFSGFGGGVHSAGTLRIIDSTIDANRGKWGGGLSVSLTGDDVFEIAGSTVSNNVALSDAAAPVGLGGGAYLESYGTINTAHATISNSTFSGNRSKEGAGLSIRETTTSGVTPNTKVEIINSTITANHTKTETAYISGGYAGGIQAFSANGTPDVTLHNTIVAGNTAQNFNYHDVWGSVAGTATASSHNIIGQIGGSGLVHNTNGNKVGTQSVLIDPLLGPLADIGGPTKTHALRSGSPAIEAGNNAVVAALDLDFDQRGQGFNRIVDWDGDLSARVDIGALELALHELYS